jgi:hypothetical protein
MEMEIALLGGAKAASHQAAARAKSGAWTKGLLKIRQMMPWKSGDTIRNLSTKTEIRGHYT